MALRRLKAAGRRRFPLAATVSRGFDRSWLEEAVKERLERNDDVRYLAQARAGRDVCWPPGADEPEPLVTVRMAVYNRGVAITRAVDSVLAQTHRNLELLIIGDQADEATCRAVEAIADTRVRFINLPAHGLYPPDGMNLWRVAGTHPMNTALALASGLWIAPATTTT